MPEPMFDTEISRVDRLTHQINNIINSDGIITEEEEVLLDSILENLSHYRIMLMDYTDDDVITDSERAKMDEFRKKIEGDAKVLAFEDENFSKDEINILTELKKFSINMDY